MHRRRFLMAMSGAMAAAAVRPAHAADPIRIGYFGPLTGNFSQTGKDMTDGFNLFWEEVGNKVAGREVKVIVEDSDPEPTGAVTKVRRLVEQEKVHTWPAGCSRPPATRSRPTSSRTRSRPLYPITAPDDITQRKPVRWIVRTSASGQPDDPSDRATTPTSSSSCGGWRTISMDYAFGWETNAGFQRVFEDLGGKVVQRIWTPLAMQDYAPVPGVAQDGHRRGLTPATPAASRRASSRRGATPA